MFENILRKPQFLSAFAFLAMASSTAHANGWKPEAIKFAREVYASAPMINYDGARDPYIATMWGAGSRNKRLALPISEYRREMTLPEHFDRPVAVEFSQHFGEKLVPDPRRRGGVPVIHKFYEKAPLIVFVPGIFADSSDITGQMTIKWFSAMRYHVLVVPNPLGPSYLKAGPHSGADSAKNDAQFVLSATRYAIQRWIGPEWVSGVMVAGESLGGAVTAAAYAQDSLDPDPLFTDGATMLWPPISLTNSVNKMDRMITESYDKYEGGCKDLLNNFRFKVRIFFGQIIKDPTDEERDCAESIIMNYGYKGDLLRTARILKTGLDPGPADPDHPIQPADDWEKALTFSTFIHELAPFYGETLNAKNPINEISYWLAMANEHGHKDWRILTSIDDFVNDGKTWKQVYDLDPDGNRLLIMPWGGHIGLSATDQFPQFLRVQMQDVPRVNLLSK